MELKELTEKTLDLFGIDSVDKLSDKLKQVCFENDESYLRKFKDLVQDLSIDWLQKIFQYYEADRKEKKQDYTPVCLGRLLAKLNDTENGNEVLDLCAGSGALTIQSWNANKNIFVTCKEFDENVIPFLSFNLMIRNIQGEIYHTDILKNEVFHKYVVVKGNEFSMFAEEVIE